MVVAKERRKPALKAPERKAPPAPRPAAKPKPVAAVKPEGTPGGDPSSPFLDPFSGGLRKSSRSGTRDILKRSEEKREALKARPKPNRNPNQEPPRQLTQAEILAEAAQTEVRNLEDLERLLDVEAAVKKKAERAKAPRYLGPAIRRKSAKNADGEGVVTIELVRGARTPEPLGQARPRLPSVATCAVTGAPAKYRDPVTGLAYLGAAEFKEIRRRKAVGDAEEERRRGAGEVRSEEGGVRGDAQGGGEALVEFPATGFLPGSAVGGGAGAFGRGASAAPGRGAPGRGRGRGRPPGTGEGTAPGPKRPKLVGTGEAVEVAEGQGASFRRETMVRARLVRVSRSDARLVWFRFVSFAAFVVVYATLLRSSFARKNGVRFSRSTSSLTSRTSSRSFSSRDACSKNENVRAVSYDPGDASSSLLLGSRTRRRQSGGYRRSGVGEAACRRTRARSRFIARSGAVDAGRARAGVGGGGPFETSSSTSEAENGKVSSVDANDEALSRAAARSSATSAPFPVSASSDRGATWATYDRVEARDSAKDSSS